MHVKDNHYCHKEMDLSQIQILAETFCVSLSANALRKGINTSLLLTAISRIVQQTEISNLGVATCLEG